jgi:ribosomal-protein-alanine N-acetyltransferase
LLGTPGVFALGVGDSFILCRAVAGEAEVLTLAVAPASRRAGLGRTLVEAAMGLAALAGADTCFLEVDNTPALNLYQTTGFEAAGLRPHYYRRPDGDIDAVVMRRDLNSGDGSPYVAPAPSLSSSNDSI